MILVLGWAPLFDDPLCVAAGWMCFNAWLCMLLFAIGKLFSYLLVTGHTCWILKTFFARYAATGEMDYLIVTQGASSQLSARCTTERFARIAQGMICR